MAACRREPPHVGASLRANTGGYGETLAPLQKRIYHFTMQQDQRRLYIHIGLGKTGTTALQRFFAHNRDALAGQGVIYPMIGTFVKTQAHHVLSHKWGGWIDPTRLADRNPTQEWHDLKAAMLSGKAGVRYLISSERFAAAALDSRYPGMLDFIASLFDGIDVKIIVYVRPQEELAESIYKQGVKAGLIRLRLEDYVRSLPGYFDYCRLLETWAQTFGRQNVIVKRYNKDYWVGQDLIHDMLSALETTWSAEFVHVGEVNPSIGAIATRLIVDLGLSEDADFQKLKVVLQNKFRQQDGGLLDSAMKTKIRTAYESSNAEVARTFLNSADGILFPPPSPSPAARPDRVELSYDALRDLLRTFRGKPNR